KALGRLQGSGDHDAASDYRDIASLPKRLGFADFELNVFKARQFWNAEPADAQKHWPLVRSSGLDGLSGLPRARRHADREIGKELEPSHILDRVMGWTQFAVSDTG